MESNNNYLRSVCKGSIGAIILSFIGIIILSLFMKIIEFTPNIFNMIYVIISLISLAIGAIIGAKTNQSKGWLVGLGIGMVYYIALFIISSYISGAVTFKIFDLAKFTISMAVGLLAGMLGINL
ncbi:TIGR04086 family membrane protein [Clostridium taeniosporum]|uniref:TIGR04086 family membrane protein n=1 Tax=Clostridium taeniosporum TaxID=394958 RepID=A0A1D7XIA0_9CLOT|nr:TIGR04086 family membrane protein [Clostridium taeniosporum]AOR23068.1 TIGR04086 family membrane protein [Clostridium taeniosporum]